MAYEIAKRLQEAQQTIVLMQLANACSSKERARDNYIKYLNHRLMQSRFSRTTFLHQKLHYIHHNTVNGKWNLCIEYTNYIHSGAAFYIDSKVHEQIKLMDYKELDSLSLYYPHRFLVNPARVGFCETKTELLLILVIAGSSI